MKYFAQQGLILTLLLTSAAMVLAEDKHGKFDHHTKADENSSQTGVFTEAKHGKSEHGKHDDDSDNDDHFIADNNNGDTDHLPNMFKSKNEHGIDATYSTTGSIDLTNPFFQSFGSNERSCATCHVPSEGWTIIPKGVQKLFDETDGLDPLFRLVDGANSPLENVATVEDRRNAYSMLLSKANIRTGIGIPADAEFKLIEVDDPYGYASETELSLYRRPLPTTNLKFLNSVMWEGRDSTLDESSIDCIFGTTTCFAPVSKDLATQANNATEGHAEALQELTDEQRRAIVDFESSLFTTQVYDNNAGSLTARKAKGGPEKLEETEYYFGINDTVDGDYRTGESFNSISMTLYDAWDRYNRKSDEEANSDKKRARAAIARGQSLFNTFPILISGVKGLNDDLGVDEIAGSCTTCHNIPNAGNHSVPLPLDIGISDASRRTPDMPLYTLRHKTTNETIQTTDPGRALITGKWKDIGRFKGPVLRAVSSRPPYFHDGSAADLNAVVDFYDTRFSIGLTDQEKAD
ncbi:MAG: hypothetical protein H0V39_05920, partial [Nitrosomonas sp.]|nr:hypothetical protein [Nitrosomonas sp.]